MDFRSCNTNVDCLPTIRSCGSALYFCETHVDLYCFLYQFGIEGVSFLDVYTLARRATMMGVTNLDLSVATQQTAYVPHDFIHALGIMLPNLRVLNLTNIGIDYNSKHVLSKFTVSCHDLEKIVWNNGRDDTLVGTVEEFYNSFDAKGDILDDCQNLNEIEMNNCRFIFFDFDTWSSDPNIFLFHRCLTKKLERVSIKNATATTATGTGTDIRFLQASW